ncbi:MAG: hypothetical protein HN417_06185 [Desulfobacula sp.]|jgi:hypothetical protein|nr:hypothetical protein [Desulfobacula sp.]MBT6339882.1 hypothetical protein [Desulfobacula sp.]MBT7261417.1 hypothetical protein [Desulfobacula sp.]
MEDISGDLESEIERSREKPHKQDLRKRVIIVDDFGEMKSGDYLKFFVKALSVISVVCIVIAGLLYFFYTELSKQAKLDENRLVSLEKEVYSLTREKEILMAKLVISGKDPGIENEFKKEDKPGLETIEEKKTVHPESEDKGVVKKISMDEPGKNNIKHRSNAFSQAIKAIPEIEPSDEAVPFRIIKKNIDIEKFSVTKDGESDDLLVRFDIRNISNEPGDVSGRIFTVLKPDNNIEDQWLVVPNAALKNGVPSEYRNGQYFSIANFKPVKFRIKHQSNPDFFTQAIIFIFNEQADLVFEKLINITEAN